VIAVIVWLLTSPIRGPLVRLPPWTPDATFALTLVLVLTLAIAAPPWSNVGRSDAEGNRYYRAYFTADFVWHTALTAEIARFSMPPRNPYQAHSPINYYWMYFLVPGAVAATGPPSLRDVERCLKMNALITGLLLMSAIFLAAWTAVPRAAAAGIAVALALVGSSAEGTATILGLLWSGRPLAELKNANIDAMSAWVFHGHRIDGLQRCLWYVPQHSMAYALGLIAVAASAAGVMSSATAALVVGVFLGGAVAMNPFVGGIFALTFGAVALVRSARSGMSPSAIPTRHRIPRGSSSRPSGHFVSGSAMPVVFPFPERR